MAEDRIEAFKELLEYAKKKTTAVSNEPVEAAPADPDWRLIVDFIAVNGNTAGSIQLLDDTNAEIDGYIWHYGANSGFVLENVFLKKITKGRGLRYTQVGGGTYSVVIKYHYEEGNLS